MFVGLSQRGSRFINPICGCRSTTALQTFSHYRQTAILKDFKTYFDGFLPVRAYHHNVSITVQRFSKICGISPTPFTACRLFLPS